MQATHFFLGANSGWGFQSLFDRFCVPEDHHDLLVLKGGPGAGKSTMMRKIGAAMEERGEQVEYLYCSGDPQSLDGVHIPRTKTAIVDGTAPHVVEPRYPGAADRYVNLGRFYDVDVLKDRREEIVRHTDACSAAYRRAYRALGAARQMGDSAAALAAEVFLALKRDGRLGLVLPGLWLVYTLVRLAIRAVYLAQTGGGWLADPWQALAIACAVENVPTLLLLAVYGLCRAGKRWRLRRQVDKTRIQDL